jgi:hypothetical protein
MIATVIIHTMVAQSTSFYEHSQRNIIAALIKTKQKKSNALLARITRRIFSILTIGLAN